MNDIIIHIVNNRFWFAISLKKKKEEDFGSQYSWLPFVISIEVLVSYLYECVAKNKI